jgi:hypothetical protein
MNFHCMETCSRFQSEGTSVEQVAWRIRSAAGSTSETETHAASIGRGT